MNKKTALYDAHLKLNAKLAPFAGWEMPISYPAGIIAEHLAVRNAVGLFDVSHMGLIRISDQIGTRRLNVAASNFLQTITTNDVSKLDVNQVQYSILCNEAGGVVDDILLFRLADHYMIVANASNTGKVMNWLKSRAAGIEIELISGKSILSVQGPQAGEAASKILGLDLSGLKHNHAISQPGRLISRTGYTGEDGFEIIVDNQGAAGLWERFIEAGVQPCGLGARDTLRLEAGLPLYGHEYDDETTPREAGYGWAVKFDKGDFIGRAALLKEKKEGLRKKLVGLEMEGRAIPRQGNLIVDSRELNVGIITSGTFSPTFKKPIALAYLNSYPLPLNPVSVEIRGEKQPARVVDKAFYKRVK